jgi:hypothetical protein
MFLKTETDQGMLKAYREYVVGLDQRHTHRLPISNRRSWRSTWLFGFTSTYTN